MTAAPPADAPLAEFPEDWDQALAVVAHLGNPDPEEFLRAGAEATAARLGGRLAVAFELLGI